MPKFMKIWNDANAQILPTNQYHRPVLHVFQLAHAGMLLLLPLHSHADDLEESALPFRKAQHAHGPGQALPSVHFKFLYRLP